MANQKQPKKQSQDQKFDRSEQSRQGQPDPDREPDRGKMSNNPQAGIDENDGRAKQPPMSPDFENKNQQVANDVDDLDDVDEEDADEDRITQRNPAQGRTDLRG